MARTAANLKAISSCTLVSPQVFYSEGKVVANFQHLQGSSDSQTVASQSGTGKPQPDLCLPTKPLGCLHNV